MEYTYKPTVNAIQYTGNIDAVIEFIGRENLQTIETIVAEDKTYERLFVALKNCRASRPREFFLSYRNYLIKESLGDNIKFKFMPEEEFVEYYQKVEQTYDSPSEMIARQKWSEEDIRFILDALERNTSAPNNAADTTPCEDKPERSSRVAEGVPYWYISTSGDAYQMLESLCALDRERWESGNYFKSKPEAIQSRDEWLLQLKYRQWRKQHDQVVLDWGDVGQRKWDMVRHYDKKDFNLEYGWWSTHRVVGGFYFSTREHAERFYAEHKDLIHRVLGVE